jgi:hypothetical protein
MFVFDPAWHNLPEVACEVLKASYLALYNRPYIAKDHYFHPYLKYIRPARTFRHFLVILLKNGNI